MKRKLCCGLYLAIWLAFPCAVFAVWCADYDLLIGTEWTAFRIQFVLNGITALIGAGFAVRRYLGSGRQFLNRLLLVLPLAGIAVLLLCTNGLCWFLDSAQEYHSFRSPDKTHTVVIMENVSLIAGRVTLCERVNPFLIQAKAGVSTDDGHRPVCAGEYALVWDGDTVTLTIADGMGGEKTISAVLRQVGQ